MTETDTEQNKKQVNTRLTLYTISYIVYTALLDKNVSINAAQWRHVTATAAAAAAAAKYDSKE